MSFVAAPPRLIAAPTVDTRPQCWRCGKVLANFVARPWSFTCPRCKAENNSPPESQAA